MFRLTVLLLAVSSAVFAQAPQRGGALPQALPLFPSGNWWNADISTAPVDPNSSAYIADVGATLDQHLQYLGVLSPLGGSQVFIVMKFWEHPGARQKVKWGASVLVAGVDVRLVAERQTNVINSPCLHCFD